MNFKYLIKGFDIAESEGCVVASIPLMMDMSPNNENLVVGIFETEDGYKLVNNGSMFEDSGMSAKDCFVRYVSDGNPTYDIRLENGIFTKEYKSDCNAAYALDDFIKFFVLFNNYVMDNMESIMFGELIDE